MLRNIKNTICWHTNIIIKDEILLKENELNYNKCFRRKFYLKYLSKYLRYVLVNDNIFLAEIEADSWKPFNNAVYLIEITEFISGNNNIYF